MSVVLVTQPAKGMRHVVLSAVPTPTVQYWVSGLEVYKNTCGIRVEPRITETAYTESADAVAQLCVLHNM
jgi:hypothetical protein